MAVNVYLNTLTKKFEFVKGIINFISCYILTILVLFNC
jgi:hypothetical protein